MNGRETGQGCHPLGFPTPRRSLFIRIFIWFWLTLTLVSLALLALTITAESGPLFAVWRRETGKVLSLYGHTAVAVYTRDGREALIDFLGKLDRSSYGDLFLFDGESKEISGRSTPAMAEEMARSEAESNEPRMRFLPGAFWTAQSFMGPDGKPYVVIRKYAKGPLSLLMEAPGALGLKLLMVLLMGWGCCYWLARNVTTPVAQLQKAARRLACGDLSVRVGKVVAHRQDELASLALDFDVMAERLESLMAAQQRLLGDVSHELRSPLARLNVALELARRGAPPQLTAPLDRIELESQRLNQLIQQVLVVHRLETGSEPERRGPLDLAGLVREIADDAGFEARSRNCEVLVSLKEPCIVDGIRGLLRTAIENVVRNALIYTGDGTQVLISLHHEAMDGRYFAILTIRDYGPGVPEADLANVFRPFYRIADSRERKTGGTGLGLAITDRIVSMHQGTVRASNAPDGGLVVRIQIPLADLLS